MSEVDHEDDDIVEQRLIVSRLSLANPRGVRRWLAERRFKNVLDAMDTPHWVSPGWRERCMTAIRHPKATVKVPVYRPPWIKQRRPRSLKQALQDIWSIILGQLI